jgi:hypothetical protein
MFDDQESSCQTNQPHMFIETLFDEGGASIRSVISWLPKRRESSLFSILLGCLSPE